VLRSDAADRPARAQAMPKAAPAQTLGTRLTLVHSARHPVTVPRPAVQKPVAYVAAAPAVHLPLVAAARIIAPAPRQHEQVVVPPAPAPAPPEPIPPLPDVAPVTPDLSAPPIAVEPAPAAPAAPPAQTKPPRTGSPPPPAQTVTVENVIQPATDAPPAADAAAPAAPTWVPPGQAKRDEAQPPSQVSTPPDAGPDPSFVPPGQAKKADDDTGRGQGKGRSDAGQP
jgi:hypothetical protein